MGQNMSAIVGTVTAGLLSLFLWCYYKVKGYRSDFSTIPHLPRTFWLGNARDVPTYSPKAENSHPDYAFEEMWKKLGYPDIFLMDIAPIMTLMVITHPFVSEQITQSSADWPHGGLEKGWTLPGILWPITGKQTILTQEGEAWRETRKRYQPGFQPNHVKEFRPLMVEEAKIFLKNLEKRYQKGDEFQIYKLMQEYALDLIGVIVLNEKFNAQSTEEGKGVKAPHGLLTAFQKVQDATNDRRTYSKRIFDFHEHYDMWAAKRALSKCFDGLTNKLIASKDTEAKARSILALSLKNQELTPEVIDHATSQLRTFLFAGYDTTASSMAWTLYFLGKKENKAALEAILEELDTVLGTDDAEVARKLGNKVGDVDLPLMINALKESMRVMPPASATRGVTKKQKDFFITFRDGSRHKVNGSMLMTANRLVMTNPNVWGEDAAIWRPSRWEDKEYIAALPPGAYRPFEHGPRDCIGRTVAMEEMKVLLAMVLRKWRFEKVTKEENISVLGEVWGEYSILTVPHDRMNGVLRRRGEEYINGAPAVYAKH